MAQHSVTIWLSILSVQDWPISGTFLWGACKNTPCPTKTNASIMVKTMLKSIINNNITQNFKKKNPNITFWTALKYFVVSRLCLTYPQCSCFHHSTFNTYKLGLVNFFFTSTPTALLWLTNLRKSDISGRITFQTPMTVAKWAIKLPLS